MGMQNKPRDPWGEKQKDHRKRKPDMSKRRLKMWFWDWEGTGVAKAPTVKEPDSGLPCVAYETFSVQRVLIKDNGNGSVSCQLI